MGRPFLGMGCKQSDKYSMQGSVDGSANLGEVSSVRQIKFFHYINN